MKKFFAIVLAFALVLSMTACSAENQITNNVGKIVFEGDLVVTKMEVLLDTGDSRFIMAAKNEEVAVLCRVDFATYLKCEIGDTIHCNIKENNNGSYYVQFDNGDQWIYAMESIGLDD